MFKSLRYALRLLGKSPGFSLVAIFSLALGIGCTAAMFSFTDALLLRPLPVEEPSQIAAVTSTNSASFGTGSALSYPDYRDFRDNNRSFDGLFAAGTTSFGLSPNPSTLPKVAYGFYVSGNFFRTLHVQPALGRGFMESEDQAVGRDPVVVLGHDYWVSQFNANPGVIGSPVWLNGIQCTIIGITPAEFTGIDQFFKPSLFVPLAMSPRLGQENILEKRDIRWLTVKGRLKPGVTVAQAGSDVAAIAERLAQTYPDSNRGRHAEVQSELTLRVKQSPPNAALSVMLMLLALCVLLVACANVTGLLLSRTRARSREIAVRLAIGAGRGALIRQLLLENLLLALGGGALGIAVAYLGTSFLNSIPIPTDVPLSYHVSVDPRMLFFTVAASLLSTFIFGLTPALQTTRVDLVTSLKAADADSGGKRRLWGRNLIVSGQVALSLVLLIVSAVMLQGFRDELQQGPGFRIDRLYLTSLDTQPIHYSQDQSRRFYKDLLEKTRRAPGIQAAALISDVPLLGGQGNGIVPEGYVLPRGEQALTVFNYFISDGFFDVTGVPILRGRAILETDRADTPMVAVVNEHMANHYWPKQDPLGKRFHLHNATGPLVQVVGIARNAKYFWIAEPPLDFMYLPYTQDKRTAMTLVAESVAPDAGAIAPVVREVVRNLDSSMPVSNARTMQDYFEQRAVKTPNIITQSVAGLGTMGLLLAMVGLYGLISYSVSRRSREIGVRMAIGADRPKVIRMVLNQGLVLGSIGVVVGLILGFFACRAVMTAAWIASFSHMNYALFPAVAVPVLLVTLLATFVPARRASLIDPMRALREE